MTPRPYQIFYAKVQWRTSLDERPWLVVDARGNGVLGCFPISGQYFGERDAFHVEATHPDFPTTGLTKSCFVYYGSIIELPAVKLARRKGEMTGRMLSSFLKAAGLES